MKHHSKSLTTQAMNRRTRGFNHPLPPPNMVVRNLVGPQICRLRMAKGWTQKHLAEQLQDAGMYKQQCDVAKIENRHVFVFDTQLVVLAKVLESPIEKILPSTWLKADLKDAALRLNRQHIHSKYRPTV